MNPTGRPPSFAERRFRVRSAAVFAHRDRWPRTPL